MLEKYYHWKKTSKFLQTAMEVQFLDNFYKTTLNDSIDFSDGSHVMEVIT